MWFVIGLFLGGVFGVGSVALCKAAARGDDMSACSGDCNQGCNCGCGEN